jgi:hypothetical protein
LREMCSKRIWERCKRTSTQIVVGVGISMVFMLFIVASAFGMVFNYLGNVMLPSRKENGGT